MRMAARVGVLGMLVVSLVTIGLLGWRPLVLLARQSGISDGLAEMYAVVVVGHLLLASVVVVRSSLWGVRAPVSAWVMLLMQLSVVVTACVRDAQDRAEASLWLVMVACAVPAAALLGLIGLSMDLGRLDAFDREESGADLTFLHPSRRALQVVAEDV